MTTRRGRLLVVEDVAMNRDLVEQVLEDDFDLSFAVDGQAGLAAVARERPDLVLLDLSLPIVDGWEVARRLKADPDLRDIPVIALTAHAMAGDEARARACGCDDFLTKPLDEALLRKCIARFVP